MGVVSLVLGIVSTLWSMIGGGWVSAAIGLAGVLFGIIGVKIKATGAAAGLFLSVNGIAWFIIYVTYAVCEDWIGKLFGLK